MKTKTQHNRQQAYIDTLNSYKSYFTKLDFSNIDSNFELIETIQEITLYVPINIRVNIADSNDKNFSCTELKFLQENNKYSENDLEVSGENVWKLYEEIIQNKNSNFIIQKKNLIIIQGLMSKFSFSVGVFSKIYRDITMSGNGEEKYGYFYLHNVNKIYDYNTGIKTLDFSDIFLW